MNQDANDTNKLTEGLTAEQRFLFDLHGFILLEDALSADEIARYTEAIYRLAREKVPDPAKWDERGEPRETIRVHRPIEKDPLFLSCVDHPAVLPLLQQLVGNAPLLIDNDVELNPRHNKPQGWHRGMGTHAYWAENGEIFCTMVKCIWYLSDVARGQNPTRIIPGSHKSKIKEPDAGADNTGPLPGQIELEVKAGTILIFSEACLHAGNINNSDRTRVNMFYNYGPSWVQPWEGYRPSERLINEATGIRKQILGGGRVYGASEEEGRKTFV